MSHSILSLTDIHKSFDQFQVLQKINLNVQDGEILALLGHSGCGKTTLLRMIAGFENLDKGSVSLHQKEVATATSQVPPEKRRVGLVFQDYALFPHLSVKQNILFGVKDKSKHQSALEEVLDLLNLRGQENKMPSELSGGQQQRVAIARALAPKPEVLLLDEPFSNLDTFLRRGVRLQLKQILKKAGVTTILVTHDQEEAFQFADRIAVMEKGEILQCASAEELYLKPANIAVASFLGNSQFIDVTVNGETIHSAFGQFKQKTEIQGKAKLLIRPESFDIEVCEQGEATIISSHFNGGAYHYQVQANEQTILLDGPLQNKLDVGTKVKLNVHHKLILFPEN